MLTFPGYMVNGCWCNSWHKSKKNWKICLSPFYHPFVHGQLWSNNDECSWSICPSFGVRRIDSQSSPDSASGFAIIFLFTLALVLIYVRNREAVGTPWFLPRPIIQQHCGMAALMQHGYQMLHRELFGNFDVSLYRMSISCINKYFQALHASPVEHIPFAHLHIYRTFI